jgi:hypothetical protein
MILLFSSIAVGTLFYVVMFVVIGARLSAKMKKDNLKRGRYTLSENQQPALFFGSVFWFGGLIYLCWMALQEHYLEEDPGKKCILCGTVNASDHAHCKHCGNLMGVAALDEKRL